MRGIGLDTFIDLVLPAGGTAMEAVLEIVLRQLVFGSVQGEAALVDAVRVPADGGAEVGGVVLREVVGDLVETQDHILQLSVAVRNHDGDDAAAEIGDAHLHAVFIRKGVEGRGGAVVLAHEIGRVQAGGREGHLLFLAAGDEGEGRAKGKDCLFHMVFVLYWRNAAQSCENFSIFERFLEKIVK